MSKRERRNPLASLSEQELAILEGIKSGLPLTEVLAPMIKRVTEAALEGELGAYLDQEEGLPNRRNGKSKKQVRSSFGEFELETPRDRNCGFDPQIVPKRQTALSEELDAKILSLYAAGMSYADIKQGVQEMYQVEISPGAISRISDRLLPEIQEWRQRPLEDAYAIVYLDAMYFKVKEEGKVETKAICSVLGVDKEGRKDILGMYLSESEGASFWAGVLADLKNRGIKDILIACVDGLKGFPEAINSLFPATDVQLCVVHQIRHSMKYVSYKNKKEFMADSKEIYRAPNKEAAEENLLKLQEKWGEKHPVSVRSWVDNWDNLSTYFKYDESVRRMIYTTNAVEGMHRMVRKYTKTKGSFTSENALIKSVYCAYKKCLQKWTMPVQNWPQIVSQLEIHFPGRLGL